MPEPKLPPLLIMAREALKADDPACALALLQDMRPKLRARSDVQVLAATAHLALGQDSDALAAIQAARKAGANTLRALQLQARIQNRIGDKAGRAQTLTELLERFPQEAGARHQLGMHHLQQGDLAAADACAAAMPDTAKGLKLRLALAYQIAVQRADVQEIGQVLDRIIAECESCPDLPDLYAVLAEFPPEPKQDLTGRLIARWPEMAARLQARRAVLDPSRAQGKASEQALILALTGQAEEARNLLATHRADNPELAETAAMIAALPPDTALRRPLVVDEGQDVTVSPQGETGTTLLVFTGLADQAMVPIEYIDRFCAAAGHSAIYLRDSGRTLYIAGVPALAEDLDGMMAALRGLLQDRQTSRLLCMGTSAGGFGAIRYGLRLEAEKVLCASPPTSCTADFLASAEDKRGRLLMRRLWAQFDAAELDVEPDLRAASGRCQVDVWHGADYPIDVAHAAHLAGCPGVHLRPIAGLDQHSSFAQIVINGALQDFIVNER
ncbi:hypothetical protein [Gemmobacter nectariphilus]|uniref:hypothetical protein n=1 Tax=Gemmobacter nectariphilus TaxID=220343 RepID=UPI0004010E5D|nr:hypothetical protein [Gemmobacter nectariphilus]